MSKRREVSGESWKKSFRRTWHIDPVTQVTPSEKEYDRTDEKREIKEALEEMKEERED